MRERTARADPPNLPPHARSLLSDEDRRRLRARRRAGRIFAWVTLVPTVLALLLIATLFFDVLTDAVSWQVVEPANSGETFAWDGGFRAFDTWERVVRLELAAQGLSESGIAAFFADPEEVRKFAARNRVELMWDTGEGPLRWIVTNARDDTVRDYGVFELWGRADEVRAELGPDEVLYLNPWLDFSFFWRTASRSPVMAGILPALVGTLYVIGLVILFALPIGVGAAMYLEEYAPDNRITRFIEVNIRNLAGIPSIVYGILGLYLFVRLLDFGPTILAAATTLGLLILPVVIIAAREAIRAVPRSLRQASYGLGSTRWQMVSRVVLPNAVGGIMTGIILAVARAIGETAPLLLVGAASFIAFLPSGPLDRYTVLPIQIYSWVAENDAEFAHVASAAIVVLLGLLLMLYALANWVRRRYERKW